VAVASPPVRLPTDLPDIERLEAVELRPGDTLIVTVPVDTTQDQADRVRAAVEAKLPGYPVLVKPASVTIEAVRDE